jgi:homoserine/homoserine lactone efflux protein
MVLHVWLSFAAASLIFGLIPGPSVCFTVAQGIKRGFSATLPSIIGQLAANTLQLLIICAGLSSLMERSAALFTVLKLAGAAYLVFVGVRQWFAPMPALERASTFSSRGVWRGFADGFVVCGTNPKALLYYAAFLPQFIVPGIDRGMQLIVLGATGLAVAALILTFYAALAGRIRTMLVEKGWWRIQNRFTGLLMAAAGATLALVHEE